MSKLHDFAEKLREPGLQLRAAARPYYLAAIWFLIVLSIGWNIKRYLTGHPSALVPSINYYVIVFGGLLFDYLVERRLRRLDKQADSGE